MGKQTPIVETLELNGETIQLETGKLAALADGSVLLRQGNTMLLATAVSAKEAREGMNFFPLSVEYREKFASAGRIPGNFHRREGRPSDHEVLICRLVDRVIRPLFPDHYRNETQIIINLFSADEETLPDSLAAFAASAAMMVSDMPFDGPISEVRVARIDGEFVVNPKRSQVEKADMNIIVGATIDNVMMVEGEAEECSEVDMVEAIKVGHEAIKEQCKAQLRLREKVGIEKNREVEPMPSNEDLEKEIHELGRDRIYEIAKSGSSKLERKEAFSAVNDAIFEKLTEKHGEEFMEENAGLVKEYLYQLQKETIRDMVLSDKVRLDGRKLDEIRNIWCEVDYLPATHGSSLFTRGETQALATVTLGTKLDEAMKDNALELSYDRFMLHYNFPPFCTGEAKPIRGVSRREVGHGNLARRSVERVLPDEHAYTIRVVSDVLESNGSSSMATVCASSLALMDAGIKLKSAVSGIAMGMISDGERFAILSDILGDEDHLGDMDFKVTGTREGICACQMDIKVDGLSYDVMIEALEQARKGRVHILDIMEQAIEAPREDLKPHAPRMITYDVPSDTIGAIIGPGGKVIQAMQKETGTTINIEEVDDKGVVTIAGTNKEMVEEALRQVKNIAATPEVGEDYDAKIVKIMPYGAFVEFMPGKQGLLHVSELSWARIDKVEDVLTEGENIKVRLVDIDKRSGKFRLSRKVLVDKPEGYQERSGGGGNRGGRNRRND